MNPFDKNRQQRRNRKHSWINGIEYDDNATLDRYYDPILTITEAEREESARKYMRNYHQAVQEFKTKTKLTSTDMAFLMLAASLQTLRWALLSHDKFRFNKASDADKFFEGKAKRLSDNDYVPASISELITSHQVPYDAVQRSDRFRSIYGDFSTGLAGSNHRYLALGHDPLAGLVIGTANIATNTLTVNDFSSFYPSYHVTNQQIDGKTDITHVLKWTTNLLVNKPEVVGASLVKQVLHTGTDVFTKQGLPVPVINTVSPETSKFLIGNQIDTYSVARGAGLAIAINKIIECCHRLFYDPHSDDIRLYEVRTRKILLYSNTLSSVLNIGYVGLTRDIKRLDVGGLLVTLWRILNDREKIRQIQADFVNQTLDNMLQKEEDEVNQQLSKWGFYV